MKKIIACISVIVAIACIAGVGTYAFVSTNHTAKNVFTTGNVSISISQAVNFSEEEHIMPGIEIPQTVWATNSGDNPCYVRIEFNSKFNNADNAGNSFALVADIQQTQWIEKNGYYYYNKILDPGEETQALKVAVVFDSKLNQELAGQNFKSDATAFAVQSKNNPVPDGKTVADLECWVNG